MSKSTKLFCAVLSLTVSFGFTTPLFAGPLTPSPTATPTSTPTPIPTTCTALNPVVTINTIGKSMNQSVNSTLTQAITGNIVDPTSLKVNAHRIPICRGTPVSIVSFDLTGGRARNQPTTAGITCIYDACTVPSLQKTEKYTSRSASDTDRIQLLPK